MSPIKIGDLKLRPEELFDRIEEKHRFPDKRDFLLRTTYADIALLVDYRAYVLIRERHFQISTWI